MTRQEVVEEYWAEFLAWGRIERATADGFVEIYSANVRTKPTEENFWLWYAGHKQA